MARDFEYFPPSNDDELTRLKARIAELEALNHDLCERVTENDEIRLHWEEIEQTRAENERMKARIAELEEERRWRKCSEELPEGVAEVLATDGEEKNRWYDADEVDKILAELRENNKKAFERDAENWNRLCVKYNKLIELKKDFCEKFKDIELEIDK